MNHQIRKDRGGPLANHHRPSPSHALSEAERQELLRVANEPRFARHIQHSRSGTVFVIWVEMAIAIPDREISLAHSMVLDDNLPNGKLIKP